MVTHTYEVVPKGWQPYEPNPRFEPFIMEVPAPDHTKVSEARSARRAYFTAMAMLQHVAEPEDFQVFDWFPGLNERGLERGPDGMPRVVI